MMAHRTSIQVMTALGTVICCLMGYTALGQAINTDFGKNRVQYHDDFDNWWRYETQNFVTYWYGKGRNIAEPVIQRAELDHDEIQNIMEHRTNDKIEIIVYTDISDLKQSNIGIEETFTSRAGETKIVGNKMFVYFDGNHNNLRIQIREGIASVYLSAMMFGDSFQEMVQNAVLLDLPEWYKLGIISYAGRYWDHELDDELRDILYQNPKYRDFEKLSQDYPKIAGHAMWFYLDQNYGKSSISNLLYLTRITRNLGNALLYVFNQDFDQIKEGWSAYYLQHFDSEEGQFEVEHDSSRLDLRNRDHVPVSHLRFSPDGRYLMYAYNHIGKYRVMIRDLETGKEKRIFKYGSKNSLQETDYNYPHIAWDPDGQEVTIVYEHRDVIKIHKYTLDGRRTYEDVLPTDIQRVYALSAIDERTYLMSILIKGYSELATFDIVSRQYQQITNDYYDDLDAEVVTIGDERGVLFASNRTRDDIEPQQYDTILPIGQFDLFFYPFGESKTALRRITQTEEDERYPYVVSGGRITYLSSANGMTNRYIVDASGASPGYAISNKGRNIIRHHANDQSNRHVYTYYHDGDYKVYIDEVDWSVPVSTFNTRYDQRKIVSEEPEEDEVFIPLAPEYLDDELQEGFKFQSRFDDPPAIEVISSNEESRRESASDALFENIIVDEVEMPKGEIVDFVYSRATASRLKFKLDNFTTKMDNEVLFEGLESYTGNSDALLLNPIGLLLKANIKDIFEDHSIVAGARFPLSFNGSEYFITYENRKRLIDRRMALYRRSITESVDPDAFPAQSAKKVSTLGLYQLKYPFDIYRSVRATGILRFDRYFLRSVDEETFGAPVSNEKRLSLRLEYVFDNTIDYALNIKHGTRYKVYLEAINQFNFEVIDGINIDPTDGFTSVLGFDARHYIPVLKHSVLALRGSGATSFGSKQNLYYLGNVNNAFANPFQDNVEIPAGDFAFKTNVFHLRGFRSNIRNGTSYGLINTELRVPLFRYFMGNFGGSSFFRNMQFVFFYDAGTAWHGASPYSDKNPLNTVTVESPPVLDLTIRYFRDPLVMGYGAGVRMRLLGYYLRVDYARGIETRVVQPARLHLSIGMDF